MLFLRIVTVVLSAASLAPAQKSNALPETTQPPSYLELRPPGPTEPLTPERRGDIMMARKMYREAIEYYKQAPQDSAVIWNKMGIAHHQMVQLDAAKKHYEKSLKLNKNYSEALNNLGAVHYARKSYRRAIGFYKRALKLSPYSASIYSNLGTAHFARKKYKDAIEAYTMALSIDPEVFESRSSYGVMLQERTVEERAKFHYYLAKVYAKAGVNDRALQYLRKALEEGYKDRDRIKEEPEFAALQENLEFLELLAMEPRVL
jgi:tetratricopeptide (TPR) repeat protein